MTKGKIMLAEIQQEAKATREILKLVPVGKSDWKPHEKSMSLGRLASHVAEIPGWFKETLHDDELDFGKGGYEPFIPKDNADLMSFFEKNMKVAENILADFPDEKMQDPWTMRQGEVIFFTLPKEQVARTWCMNHWYHHRAQLGVYLRLLNIPVPITYGSSADSE